jgi:DNA-binding transcriptional MerR regulator
VNKAPDAFRTISEVAEDLELPQHVLRFWETRFSQIRPMKRGGGRRYYRPDDVDLLRGIRHLLYGEGYTIRGVQRILKDHGPKFVQTVWQAGAPQPAQAPGDLEPEAAVATNEGVGEASRGLFRLLPSLLGRGGEAGSEEMPARREPAVGVHMPADESDDLASRPASPMQGGTAETAGLAVISEMAAANGTAASRRLVREQIVKLEATLAELTECRRLIDMALAENC